MSDIPDDEYRAIKRSWREAARDALSKPARWTPSQCLDACHENHKAAAKHLAYLRDLNRNLPPDSPRRQGDKNQMPLEYLIRKARAEVEHWAEYVRYYQRQADLAAESTPERSTAIPEPQPDRRLPREPEDDSDIPF